MVVYTPEILTYPLKNAGWKTTSLFVIPKSTVIPKRNPSSTFKVHRLSTWRVFKQVMKILLWFFVGFFYWKHFSMRFASFFWKIAMTTLFWCVSHALTRAPWVMDFSFAPPRGNNSAVRSGLRPTVIPAAEVGGWWLVVSGWWLAISRVIFTNSISRELGCLLHGFTWKWKWIRWIQRGLFSKCFTRR